MPTTTITTGCKINYFLRIKERLPSGYHSLETLFIPLSAPSDTLVIEHTLQPGKTNTQGSFTLSCTCAEVSPGNNTLQKAYSLFCSKRPLRTHLSVHLYKNVPLGSGLGGASANAAGFLLFLEGLATLEGYPPFFQGELTALAARVGADVPCFLTPGVKNASGIGEVLHSCHNPLAGFFLVVVSPPVSVPTAWAFNALDEQRENMQNFQPNSLTSGEHRAISSLSNGDTFRNDFEEVVFPVFPELKKVKASLLEAGAVEARLSGTGSSVFGVFKQEKQACGYKDASPYNTWVHTMQA